MTYEILSEIDSARYSLEKDIENLENKIEDKFSSIEKKIRELDNRLSGISELLVAIEENLRISNPREDDLGKLRPKEPLEGRHI